MVYEPTYNLLSETDDLYAHESQILIKQIGGVDYLFLLYMSNKYAASEWQTVARARLRVFNLATKAHIRTWDLFYAGLVAGIQIPPDPGINVPRMYFYGDNTIRAFCSNETTLFTRDVNITDPDPANWTAGNISIAQMTMQKGDGDDELLNVTATTIQTHLEQVLGETNALYNGLMPLFRNMDIAKSGDNWYAVMEFSGERASVASNIVVTLISADAGNTWSFGNLVTYTVLSRTRIIEASVFFIDTVLHLISRATTNIVQHISSEDNGGTWTQQDNITLTGVLQSKPCAVNYNDGTVKNQMAITEVSKYTGNSGRTTLWIGTTTDFVTYTRNMEIVTPTYAHYPSMFYYDGHLYMSYTKGDGTTDRNKIVIVTVF